MSKAVMVLEWEDPTDPDLFQKVAARIGPALDDSHVRPKMIHLGTHEVAEQVLGVFPHLPQMKEDEMGGGHAHAPEGQGDGAD